MKRVLWIGLLLLAVLVAAGLYLYIQRDKAHKDHGAEGVLLFSVNGLEVYSKDGRLRVGDNDVLIKVKEGNLEGAYFYMPPMPGMGEMRSDVKLIRKGENIYGGRVNLSMAGYWQFIAVLDGKNLKFDLNIPYSSGQQAHAQQNIISLDHEKVRLIGVQSAPVEVVELLQSFSTVGYVTYDLSKVYDITVRSDGWVIDTFSRFEGELIRKGEPLMRVLNPEAKIAQEELRLAEELGRENLQRLAREKLGYLQGGEVITSPVSGVVLEKRVYAGGSVKAGDTAYRIANLSSLWIIAYVPVEYLPSVYRGMKVMVVSQSSKREFFGTVDYIFPEVSKETRSAKVRVRLKDYSGFKINEPLEVYFEMPLGKVLGVPESAVVDTGRRQIVFVEVEHGQYEPREVKLGRRAEGYYEVLSGLKEGEKVVIKGTFLLDSEAQLKGVQVKEHHR